MSRRDQQGPRLPKELRDQFGTDDTPHGRTKSRPIAGRKERRKEARTQKKQQHQLNSLDRRPRPEPPQNRNVRTNAYRPSTNESLSDRRAPVNPSPRQEDKKVDSKISKPKNIRDEPILKPKKNKISAEDAEIAFLEKQLGLKGKKSLKGFEDDGLDMLLEGLDDDSDDGEFSKNKRKSREDEEWLARKRTKTSAQVTADSASEDDASDVESGLSDLTDVEDDIVGPDDDTDMGSCVSDDGGDDFEGFESEPEETDQKRVRENPYAPPVDPNAIPAEKYVPPSLRKLNQTDSEDLSQLRRQIQGKLNRLSEANILSILNEVEEIYRVNARQHVTSTIIDLLMVLLSDRTLHQDTFMILHSGFITAVYKVIGTDFGAQMVERIVTELDHYSKGPINETNKQPTNLITLATWLYNFQVIGCNLIFDYIRLLLSEFTDMNTELLLRIIKISGPQLRQDDPSSLKDIVVLLQKAIAEHGEENLPVRTKFMVETINNLKNNRMKTGVASASIISEHMTRMKKALGSLNTRSIRGTEPLRIGLDDIRNTEKRGKWWLVGASWKNEANDAAPGEDKTSTQHAKSKKEDVVMDDSTVSIADLAREQGMNTDIRRAIFFSIMSASDYKDAHLRLLKLRLKRSQELEIPKVLLQCSGSEKTYNPYYTLIAGKLCMEKKMCKAFQFSLWDVFRQCGEHGEDEEQTDDQENAAFDARKLVNLARMYGDLIANGSIPLDALKTLRLAYLQPKTKLFVEILFVTLIVQSQKKSPNQRNAKRLQNILEPVMQHSHLTTDLQYFLKKVVSKSDIIDSEDERKTVQWGCKKMADGLLGASTSQLEE